MEAPAADIPHVEPKESIKLTRNSKGYNWEVRVFRENSDTDEKWMERLMELEMKLAVKYGVSE